MPLGKHRKHDERARSSYWTSCRPTILFVQLIVSSKCNTASLKNSGNYYSVVHSVGHTTAQFILWEFLVFWIGCNPIIYICIFCILPICTYSVIQSEWLRMLSWMLVSLAFSKFLFLLKKKRGLSIISSNTDYMCNDYVMLIRDCKSFISEASVGFS